MTCGRYPPPVGCMSHYATVPSTRLSVWRTILWGTQWGQLDSGKRPVVASLQGRVAVDLTGNACTQVLAYLNGQPSRELLCPSGGSAVAPATALKIVTWLILPVVICLSQRLSHACLSISNLYGETANGSLNQLSFI